MCQRLPHELDLTVITRGNPGSGRSYVYTSTTGHTPFIGRCCEGRSWREGTRGRGEKGRESIHLTEGRGQLSHIPYIFVVNTAVNEHTVQSQVYTYTVNVLIVQHSHTFIACNTSYTSLIIQILPVYYNVYVYTRTRTLHVGALSILKKSQSFCWYFAIQACMVKLKQETPN